MSSSDAAAVLRGLHESQPGDITRPELEKLALEVGADAIFITGDHGVEDLQYFRREVKDVPMTVVSAGPSAMSVDQCKNLGYQIILYIATINASLRAIRDTYLRVKETGYLPEVPQEQADEMRNLTNTLLGFEEKWAVEAATTEAPQS